LPVKNSASRADSLGRSLKIVHHLECAFALSDLHIPKQKAKLLQEAEAQVREIRNQYDEGLITDGERYNNATTKWWISGLSAPIRSPTALWRKFEFRLDRSTMPQCRAISAFHPELILKTLLGGIGDGFEDGNFRRYSFGSIISWLSSFIQAVTVSWTTWELTQFDALAGDRGIDGRGAKHCVDAARRRACRPP
jgi:hypothetical protein